VLEGRARLYVNITRLADAAMDKIGQIPKGRQNGFDLEPKLPWKQNHCSLRAFWPDIFAILTPQYHYE
jgi:hypothetical protein